MWRVVGGVASSLAMALRRWFFLGFWPAEVYRLMLLGPVYPDFPWPLLSVDSTLGLPAAEYRTLGLATCARADIWLYFRL